ncbi:MAG TPA: hypothetical protein DCS15_04065 [Flavobacteriales bacterium]|jgi:hypothetical protein|nr:hypothetical protein [Flavobacteriales bacterium]
MSASTKTEFNPDYFKSIFGDDNEDWRDFIEVNLNTYRDGCDKIKASIESGDMDQIKEVRHALSPTLQQWNALTLERGLMALDSENIHTHWPPLAAEFEAIFEALMAL